MDNSVYLGVRIPDVPYQRIAFNDINLEHSLGDSGLRERAASQFNLPGDEIVFVYQGRALEANANLHAQGVRKGATIHVMRKKIDPEVDCTVDQVPLSDEKLRQITSTFKRFTASRLWELSYPRVLSRILKLYPAIRDDLGALAILRDPILLSSMKSAENFQAIAKQYPIFNQAAHAIVDILQKLDSTTKVRVPEFEDSESSSSSSSSEDLTANNNNNNNNNENSRPITERQLAEALAFVAGAAFRSAQNNNNAATTTATSESSSREQSQPRMVSSTLDSSASGSSMNIDQPPPALLTFGNEAAPNVEELAVRYAQELIQMREMGLVDEQVNLHALQICNGDLEAAINLVFSSSN